MPYVENRDPQLEQPHDVPIFPKDHEKQTIENSFPRRSMKILGILQIICGVLVIGLQVCETKMISKLATKTCYYDISTISYRFCLIL